MPSRPPGRPEAEIDLEEMQKWARAGATYPEIAQRLGISHATLEKRLLRPDFKKAYDEARAEMIISLRSKQVQLAMAGNPTMLIWLGKQFLGQKDRHEHSGTGSDGAIVHTTEAAERMKAEYDALAERLSLRENSGVTPGRTN